MSYNNPAPKISVKTCTNYDRGGDGLGLFANKELLKWDLAFIIAVV